MGDSFEFDDKGNEMVRIMRYGAMVVGFILVIGTTARAAIPEPSVLVYGTLKVSGIPITANDDVRIYARVPESPDEVGSYQVGTNVNIDDMYAIQFRLESLADGSSQSANRALVGPMAQIYADAADVVGGPVLLGNFKICDRGLVLNVNLPGTIPGTIGDFDNDCDLDVVASATGRPASQCFSACSP